MIYVVYQLGPFQTNIIVAYPTAEMAQLHCDTMNEKSHYKYYWEEIELRG